MWRLLTGPRHDVLQGTKAQLDLGEVVDSAKEIKKQIKEAEKYVRDIQNCDFDDYNELLAPKPVSVLEGTTRSVAPIVQPQYTSEKLEFDCSLSVLHLHVQSKSSIVEKIADLALQFPGQKGLIICTMRSEISSLEAILMERGVQATVIWADNTEVSKYENVRWVVHNSILPMARFLEHLVTLVVLQANQPVTSVLYWSLNDYTQLSEIYPDSGDITDSIHSIMRYCIERKTCRIRQLASLLVGVSDPGNCGNRCDNCLGRVGVDVTAYAREAIRVVQTAVDQSDRKTEYGYGGRMVHVTANQVVDVLLGKGRPALRRSDWVERGLNREQVEAVVAKLIVDRRLFEHFVEGPASRFYRKKSYLKPADRKDPLILFQMKFEEILGERKQISRQGAEAGSSGQGVAKKMKLDQ